MSTIIDAITAVVKAVFVGDPTATPAVPSWISTAVSAVTSNPIILFAVLIPFVGVGISLLRRLFKSKA